MFVNSRPSGGFCPICANPLDYSPQAVVHGIVKNHGGMIEVDSEVDLVITDLTMPHMTGLQLAEQLALMRPGIPIILCSGLGDKDTRKEAKATGIKQFLYKPISIYRLAETVRQVLNEKL
jgi:DNA-binding NtrC family response regulator